MQKPPYSQYATAKKRANIHFCDIALYNNL